ncbi:MAG TPA: winged helix-turn-helix domain-containing protein [Luteimonas sp.]|nr:winged helix-turn-helix domain-containing protein [Luteimonas sp.]
MQDARGRHYRFGPFQLDLQTRELRRDGTPLVLTAKAFDVLRVLVENRERVVGRDELLATVWAGRVVEENNLTQAITALRRAFGTGAQEHLYIVTVPGRGYRFVADVEEGTVVDAEAATAAAAAPDSVPAQASAPVSGRHRALRLAIAALLVVVAVPLAWRALREPASPPAQAPAPADTSSPLTLAVLPFHPLSSGEDDALLGLGLADTLITRISTSTSLRVSPLSSSQRLAGAKQAPTEAARQLGVAYLVEGTTQRRGDEVKVNARLLTADGEALWSGSFDAHTGSVFTLQDRIADALANALAVKVAAAARRSPCDGANADAYRAYLSGQYRISRPSADSARQALADYRRALDLDPTCARAYAAMANAYRTLVATADADPQDNFARATTLVDRALSLDPHLPEAHLMRGWIAFWYDWDWAASETAFKRAIELNPSLADAYFGYAHLLLNLGRGEEAAAQARMAMALDPLSPVINAIGGLIVAPPGEGGRYLERALELDPDYWLALLMRGFRRLSSGDAGGMADLERARELCGDCSHALTVRGGVEARAGNRDATRAILRQMEARDREGYWPASALATLHNALGETDVALDLLERAWRERDLRMAFLKLDEGMRWRNLRDEPRYRALMQQMDFTQDESADTDVTDVTDVRTSTPTSSNTSAADRSSQ